MELTPIDLTANNVDDNAAPLVEVAFSTSRIRRTTRISDDPNNPDALRTVCETGDVACRFTDAYYCHYRPHKCKFGLKCHSIRYTEAQVTNHMTHFHKDMIDKHPDTPSNSMVKKLKLIGTSKKQKSPPESSLQVVSAPVVPMPAQSNNAPAPAQTATPGRNRSSSVTTPRVANNDQKRNAFANIKKSSFRKSKSLTIAPLLGIHGIAGIKTDPDTMDVHASATMEGKCIRLVKTNYAATVKMADGSIILMHHLPCSARTHNQSDYCYHHFRDQGLSVPNSVQFY